MFVENDIHKWVQYFSELEAYLFSFMNKIPNPPPILTFNQEQSPAFVEDGSGTNYCSTIKQY